MPTSILKGNVSPSDMPKYSEGLASGMAWRMTAGTAMYDALAASTISKAPLPADMPVSMASSSASAAWLSGPAIA